MSESEGKPLVSDDTKVGHCECHLVPDPVKGWKIRVCGCERELEEIEENLGPHSRGYLRNRIEKVEP